MPQREIVKRPASDISSQAYVRKYQAFASPHRIHMGRDTHNRTNFLASQIKRT